MKKRSKKPVQRPTSVAVGTQEKKHEAPAAPGYAGAPLDGSQYVDVIEEQAYADQRPTPEEQKPRFAWQDRQPPGPRQ